MLIYANDDLVYWTNGCEGKYGLLPAVAALVSDLMDAGFKVTVVR